MNWWFVLSVFVGVVVGNILTDVAKFLWRNRNRTIAELRKRDR